ncbi:hypothetical protein D9615_006514 [Tricholomella constricta]|uniref:Enoyl reductase (ER) domain-containing protein n=1 Tax=Tricholomella constricta TaxID=117010 RepID=A0A8H5H9W1_9AGAR|nr:hypothetical protein D9615_006514 [Tricholomella constricta]
MSIPTSAREYFLPQIGTHDTLTIRTKEVEKPRANDVLVKVHAVSLQFRDLVVASGRYPVNPPPNLVPCSDMAGEIVQVGVDVKGWKVGDRVCANFATDHVYGDATPAVQRSGLGGQSHGVLTEYRTFPAYSLVSIPQHLSYEEASTLPQRVYSCAALTAYNSLLGPVPVKAGDYVLVLGTGGVSIFGLQFAVASGAIVIATSSSDEKLKIASKLGAKHVINYNTTPNWDEEILKIASHCRSTNGAGVDHVIEVGGQGTLLKSIQSTRNGGQLHIIGFVSKDSTDAGTIVLNTITRAVTLRGIQIGSVAQFGDMNRLISANPDATRPLVDKVFPFEEAKQAYDYLASQRHVGKVVIKVA